ncbi:MAG: hypothetical protein KGJ23_08315 [Euryarchaeota archaeon]|nr:hypothetical protein [Euryarchaeota archaeon]MDE1836606.1 hypothetical protein [Euryarchaeota archaeon]MDE1879199.1 hypothetical protein [Euryarchaeota archaeon]MDE2044576.1 hypothetical protein [Thermoplasmata archaeon]
MAGEPSSIPSDAQVLVKEKDGVEDKTYVYDDGKNIVVERNLDFEPGSEPAPLGKREGVTLQAGRRNIKGHDYHTVRKVFYEKAKGFDVAKVMAELPKLLEYEGKCPHCSKAAEAAKPLRVPGSAQPAKTGGSSRTPRQPKVPKPADWSKLPAPAFKPRPPPRPKSAPPAPGSSRAPAPSGPTAPPETGAPGTGPFHIAEEGATVPRSGFLGFGVVGSLGVLPSSGPRSGRVAEPGRMRSSIPHVPRPGLLKDIGGDAREAIDKLKQNRPRLSEVFSF